MRVKPLIVLALVVFAVALTLWAPTGSSTSFTLGTAPSNPAAGKVKLWGNSSTGGVSCLNSSGGDCTAAKYFTTTGTGNYWPFGLPQSITAQTNHGANKMVYFEFSMAAGVVVQYIGGFLNTLDSGKHYTFCLYDAPGTTLLSNGGTLTDGGTNLFRVTLPAPITLTPGSGANSSTFLLGFTTDSTTIALSGVDSVSGGGTLIAGILNLDATKRIFTGSNDSSGTTTLTCPATVGMRSAASDSTPPVAFMP